MFTSEYDLVVLDLDGTLLDPHRPAPIRPRVKTAIRRLLEGGIAVTLATGRTFEFARPIAHELGISEYLVTSQGAVVAHSGSGAVLHRQTISPAMAEKVRRWATAQGRVVAFYLLNGGGLTVCQNLEVEPSEVYEFLFGSPRIIDPELNQTGELLKFIIMDEPPVPMAERRQFEPEVVVARSHHRLVEGTAAGVNKGTGLVRLLDERRLDGGRVVAIGDNDNDLPIFAEVGLSVAMGNASAEVRRAANRVTQSIENDGVAVALEEIFRL